MGDCAVSDPEQGEVADKVLEGDKVPVLVSVALEVAPQAGFAQAQRPVFSYRIRPVEEYSGYTWFHLPELNCNPDCPKNVDAIFAIFAARMAFSNLTIRSLLK